MPYNKTNWKNGETPLNADNMNHIEDGIFSSSEAIDGLTAIIPNGLAVQNSKLGFTKDNVWLPSQSAISLEGFQYDEGTKTLKTVSNVVVTFED